MNWKFLGSLKIFNAASQTKNFTRLPIYNYVMIICIRKLDHYDHLVYIYIYIYIYNESMYINFYKYITAWMLIN